MGLENSVGDPRAGPPHTFLLPVLGELNHSAAKRRFWWPLSVLERLKQEDCRNFKASIGYKLMLNLKNKSRCWRDGSEDKLLVIKVS